MHPACVACGASNPQGLRLQFAVRPDGSVSASFRCSDAFQSYPGTVHGGVVSALLDAAMTNLLFSMGVVAVTAELNVRFVAPVHPDRHAVVRASVARRARHGLHFLDAEIEQDARIVARASAKFRATGA